MAGSSSNNVPLPEIKVNDVAYLPLLPGVKAFDVESIRSANSVSPATSKRSSRTSLVSTKPPKIPRLELVSSLSQDLFGKDADVQDEVAAQPEAESSPEVEPEPEFQHPGTAEVDQYSTKSLPTLPTPNQSLEAVMDGLAIDVPVDQPKYVWQSGYDLENSGRALSRTASVCHSEFSFAPSVAEKEAIEQKWRSRINKRETYNMQVLIEDREGEDEAKAKEEAVAKTREAKRAKQKKRTSRQLGQLGPKLENK
jgi:hypothetical protein